MRKGKSLKSFWSFLKNLWFSYTIYKQKMMYPKEIRDLARMARRRVITIVT